VKIRTARTNDAPALAQLIVHLGYPSTPQELPPRLGVVERQGDTVLVAEDDAGKVIGFSALHVIHTLHQRKPLGYITAFVTDPGEQRTGVGRKLLAASEEWARERGCYRLSVTSAEQRAGAHAFYEACGYPMTGRRFGKDL
jgi:GNAT superfamily N-acetyltransferase